MVRLAALVRLVGLIGLVGVVGLDWQARPIDHGDEDGEDTWRQSLKVWVGQQPSKFRDFCRNPRKWLEIARNERIEAIPTRPNRFRDPQKNLDF